MSQVWNRSSSSKHKLSWYVSSVGLASAVVIPEQNFMSVSDVGQSIFQVTVVCPAGYSQVASDWLVLCGDSQFSSAEAWDDGNTVDGDGCASDCQQIENGWICTDSSTGQKDTCSKWAVGYVPNSQQDKCVQASVSDNINALRYSMIVLTVIGSLLNISSSMLNKSSPQSTFSFMNAIQLFLLLPLLGSYVHNQVVDLLVGLDFFFFSLSFLK